MKDYKISIRCYEEYCNHYVEIEKEDSEKDRIYNKKVIKKMKVDSIVYNDVVDFIKRITKEWEKEYNKIQRVGK